MRLGEIAGPAGVGQRRLEGAPVVPPEARRVVAERLGHRGDPPLDAVVARGGDLPAASSGVRSGSITVNTEQAEGVTAVRSRCARIAPSSAPGDGERVRRAERHPGDVRRRRRRGRTGGRGAGRGSGRARPSSPCGRGACPRHMCGPNANARCWRGLRNMSNCSGLLPVPLVVVRRAHVDHDHRAGRDLDPLDDRVARRGAQDREQRRLPPQALLDRLVA